MNCFPLLILLSVLPLSAGEVEPAKLACGDAIPVEPGSVEIGLAAGFIQANRAWDDQGFCDDRGGRYRQTDGAVGFVMGVVPDLDCGITSGYTRIDDHAMAEDGPEHGHGVTDVTLAAKWRFLDAGALHAVVQPILNIPTGGHLPENHIPTISDHWSVGGMIIATWILAPVVVNVDAGTLRHLRKQDHQFLGEWLADLAIGWQITDWCQPEAELNYSRLHRMHEDLPDSDTWAVTTGLLFPTRWGRFALGVQQGLAGHNADRTTMALGHWVRTF